MRRRGRCGVGRRLLCRMNPLGLCLGSGHLSGFDVGLSLRVLWLGWAEVFAELRYTLYFFTSM